MTRKTNPEIIAEFAALLTDGAKEMAPKVVARLDTLATCSATPDDLLEATQEWRKSLWKKLKECEERMCPKPPE